MDDIEDQIIIDIHDLAGPSPEGLSWSVDVYETSYALELGDGSLLVPVNDLEGNEPGAWHGKGISSWEDIIGSFINSIEPMSTEAMEYRNWNTNIGYRPPVLSLSTGEQVFPTNDPEGNQLGVLHRIQQNDTFIIDFEQSQE